MEKVINDTTHTYLRIRKSTKRQYNRVKNLIELRLDASVNNDDLFEDILESFIKQNKLDV